MGVKTSVLVWQGAGSAARAKRQGLAWAESSAAMLERGLRAEKRGAGSFSLRVLWGWGHPHPHPYLHPHWDSPEEELKVLKAAPNPAGFHIPLGFASSSSPRRALLALISREKRFHVDAPHLAVGQQLSLPWILQHRAAPRTAAGA